MAAVAAGGWAPLLACRLTCHAYGDRRQGGAPPQGLRAATPSRKRALPCAKTALSRNILLIWAVRQRGAVRCSALPSSNPQKAGGSVAAAAQQAWHGSNFQCSRREHSTQKDGSGLRLPRCSDGPPFGACRPAAARFMQACLAKRMRRGAASVLLPCQLRSQYILRRQPGLHLIQWDAASAWRDCAALASRHLLPCPSSRSVRVMVLNCSRCSDPWLKLDVCVRRAVDVVHSIRRL